MLATSEPAPGSETPMQPTAVAGDRRHQELRQSASEPKRASAGVHMSVCTPIAIGTPPQLMWPSASAITTEYE